MVKFHSIFEKFGKIEEKNLVTRISHLQNFDTTPLPVCTVDGESLSEIAIHNFEKNRNSCSPHGRDHVPRSTEMERERERMFIYHLQTHQ